MKNFELAEIKVPILDWLPNYDIRNDLLSDIIAGLTVFMLLIPQGMAYAVLAAMPPVYGLYTATIPLLIYAMMGTSRQLSLGPFAITSLLLGTICKKYSFEDGSPEYIQLAAIVSMISGFICLLLGIFRMGALANFLSHSVITGFITASACVIALSQMKYLLGIHVPRFPYSHQTIIYICTHLHETNPNAVAVGVVCLVGLYAAKVFRAKTKQMPANIKSQWWFKAIQGICTISNLIAIAVGSVVAYFLIRRSHLSPNQSPFPVIPIVGTVPSGLLVPEFSFNLINFNTFLDLLPDCFVLSIIGFTGNWAICVRYGELNHYECSATQELIAQGFANILGVLFHGFFASGGLARTSVNAESGARTQLAGIITSVCIMISLLCLTRLFYYIPMAVLGAIIEVSVVAMMDFDEIRRAYKVDKRDCFVMVATLVVTFFVGVSQGVIVGVVLSLLTIQLTISFPPIVHLGRIDKGGGLVLYRDVKRFKEAQQLPGVAMVRMDSSLFFANATHFKEVVLSCSKGEHHSGRQLIRLVILDVSAWVDIDLAGINTLQQLYVELKGRTIRFVLALAKGGLRDHLENQPFGGTGGTVMGKDLLFPTIELALESVAELTSPPTTSLGSDQGILSPLHSCDSNNTESNNNKIADTSVVETSPTNNSYNNNSDINSARAQYDYLPLLRDP